MVRNEEKVGTLEDEAVKRRQRLLALKKRRNKGNAPDDGDSQEKGEGQEEEDESLPPTQVLFRNYKPKSDNLEEAVLPSVEPADVENLVREQIEDGEKAKEEVQVEISNLAPKKITFDLKRGIQAQLDKLDRRTDKAIAELIRQRLKEGKQQDFLIAVNAGAQVNRRAGFDSDED
ncbi:coiled-coil domain-containing protein 12-like [Macrobrachium nipponense]|uniref:coiled-coil domain-containing protein 12-like n=1 Tax=Macrobrachium nipponense TaxID=159736 RepID=UPI0030C82633